MIYTTVDRGEVIVANDHGVPVAVLVPWDDPDETPLEAIGRLNNEVLELAA